MFHVHPTGSFNQNLDSFDTSSVTVSIFDDNILSLCMPNVPINDNLSSVLGQIMLGL